MGNRAEKVPGALPQQVSRAGKWWGSAGVLRTSPSLHVGAWPLGDWRAWRHGHKECQHGLCFAGDVDLDVDFGVGVETEVEVCVGG